MKDEVCKDHLMAKRICGCYNEDSKRVHSNTLLVCPMCGGKIKDQVYTDGGEEHGNFYCLSVSCYMPPITFRGRVEHKEIIRILVQRVN